MPSDAVPMHLETLLEHEDFVRALARSLVRDPAAADDVVQETWISALTTPPRALTSARGWLARVARNHALNARRESSRRMRREEIAARDERDDSGEMLSERLALQQRVASAVLALREPYRGVILLHYHAGLSAEEIAKKRGIPSGTVRSQITRGLDVLRADLDAEFGDRSTWCALLLPLTAGSGGGLHLLRTTSAKFAASALIVAGGIVAAVAWRTNAEPNTRSSLVASAPTSSFAAAASSAKQEPASAPETSNRAAIPARAHGGPSDEALASHSLRELLALALHTQSELRARLLEPSAEMKTTYADLLAQKDAGLARIIERKRFDLGKPADALGLDGNGSYYSFTRRTNDYQADPSVKLEQNQLDHAARGLIIDLGVTDVPAPSLNSAAPPSNFDAKQTALWSLAWSDVHVTDRDYLHSFDERQAALSYSRSTTAVRDHTYLLRSFEPGQHDILATFTLVEQDAYGFTLAWRILQRWEIHGPRRGMSASRAPGWLPDAPEWLKSQSAEELLATLERIRKVAERHMFDVPADIQRAQAQRTIDGSSTLLRIVNRGDWQPLVSMRGGGAYYSFSTHSNDYDAQPDVELQNGGFSSGFAGRDLGFVLDLGEVRLEDVGRSATEMSPKLNEFQQKVWRFLWEAQTTQASADRLEKSFSDDVRQKAHDLGVSSVPAEVGHTYIVRSVIGGVHDVVGAFTVLAQDEAGLTLIARTVVMIEESKESVNKAQDGLPGSPR